VDEKEKYAIEAMFDAASELMGYKIAYSIAVDQSGGGIINSFDSKGVGGYNIIQKQCLTTVYACYDKNIPIKTCVKKICEMIDKNDFKEKTDDPFWWIKK